MQVDVNYDEEINLKDLHSSNNSRASDNEGRAIDTKSRAEDCEHNSSDKEHRSQHAHVDKGREPHDTHATASPSLSHSTDMSPSSHKDSRPHASEVRTTEARDFFLPLNRSQSTEH